MNANARYTVSALSEAQSQSQSLFRYIAPDLILPNPKQPRRSIEPEALASLKESIHERGILQPLLVMRGDEGRYILVAGQRRLAAARELSLVRVPVMVLNEERPDYLIDSLLENIQREELSGIDEGYSFLALKEEFNWSQREIAARIHKHESYVSERIRTAERLTTTTKEIISEAFVANENLARAKFSHSINRKLALLPAEDQENLARYVADHPNIRAREVEGLVRDRLNSKNKTLAKSGEIKPAKKTASKKLTQNHSQQLILEGMVEKVEQEVEKQTETKAGKKSKADKKLMLEIDPATLETDYQHTLELLNLKISKNGRISLEELIKAIRQDFQPE